MNAFLFHSRNVLSGKYGIGAKFQVDFYDPGWPHKSHGAGNVNHIRFSHNAENNQPTKKGNGKPAKTVPPFHIRKKKKMPKASTQRVHFYNLI